MTRLATYRAAVSQGRDLTQSEMRTVMRGIMRGAWADGEIAEFLLSLRVKGEATEEVAGAVQALRELMTRIESRHTAVLDTCGTGGDGLSTFNVSTAAALVVAAHGIPVAKHGNRGVSSRSGSADVLQQLGVRVDAPLPVVEKCLDELGICFCFAPLWHPSVRSVSEIRARLGVATIFNWIGPLCNPAEAAYQLIGVGRADLRDPVARVASRLGTLHTVVVHGSDGLDEVTLSGPTEVSCATAGAGPTELNWTPGSFGLEVQPLTGTYVDSSAASADIIRAVLAGARGPARDLVTLNAAAALWTAGVSGDLCDLRVHAESAIDSGKARRILQDLGELSHDGE
ncbi:MAG TPA: anthranilate phosphoribosyltransferase [Pirellulaceae bacterium]